MLKDKLQQNMEAKAELKYIFSNINEWLKFGEAKHAGLIIFNSGLIVGLLSSYNSIQGLINKPVMVLFILSFGISIFASMVSLLPITRNLFFNKKPISDPNIYFFGHLAHLDATEFISVYKQTDPCFTETELDTALINQILMNARIANSKFLFFKFASYLSVFGFGILGITTIINSIWHF